MITIAPLRKFTPANAKEIGALLGDLRETPALKGGTVAKDLRHILKNKNAMLFAVKDSGEVIGIATLYISQKIGKKTGTVEDVVVSANYRGQGLGEKLMQALIQHGKKLKLSSLNLTSRPARVAANKLYQKIGFSLRETNVYKYSYAKAK